ncbi:MAG: YkgJ family cysteine cluster protein [Deltaproteobacteria bacterium]|nr:YkgJ family cysteine cluster protein [Deltaproteobacteria bacterium]
MGPLRFLKKILLFNLWCAVFVLQMTIYWSERLTWKLLRYEKKTRFVRRGSCQRTGLCCQTLAIELPASWVKRGWVVRFFQGWYGNIHNFQPAGDPQGRLLPFSCGYLKDGNLCSVYPYRPKLCREYPFVTLFGSIELHRGCGFWFVERSKLGGFGEVLAGQEHEAERRQYLSEKTKIIPTEAP